MTCTTTTALQ